MGKLLGVAVLLAMAIGMTDPASAYVNARDLGALGNGSADDTQALQNCINQAQTLRTSCYIPGGQYVISSTLSISSRVAIYGDGIQGTQNYCYFDQGCLYLDAGTTSRATTILPSAGIHGIYATTNDAIQVRDLQIVYLNHPAPYTGISGIAFTGTGGNNGLCSNSRISNVLISGSDRGISIGSCVEWWVSSSKFYDLLTYSIVFGNSAGVQYGDWEINDNTFISGSTSPFSHLLISSGGGGRIVGNKFNTAGSANSSQTTGISINPQLNNTSVEPLTIVGNSCEGLNACIRYTNSCPTPSSCTATQGVITGNQMWDNFDVVVDSNGAGAWVSGLVISGNLMNVNGGSGASNINISSASNVNIVGNLFGNTTGQGSTAIVLGAGTSNIGNSGNLKSGNTQ
ncbi:glycosyl hydrolase family 28-related protein [Bradyrhizobium sp. HKCCYLS1011]|uniref:glycosyl hydrolase family 28-related protein n=1 Tax=Bradyrhizobium sp. HKCCYLS1011 TaxID=3420733 RepID=UPI003EC09A58